MDNESGMLITDPSHSALALSYGTSNSKRSKLSSSFPTAPLHLVVVVVVHSTMVSNVYHFGGCGTECNSRMKNVLLLKVRVWTLTYDF